MGRQAEPPSQFPVCVQSVMTWDKGDVVGPVRNSNEMTP